MCDFLGVPIAEEKTVGPFTTLQFAGITLDSVSQEARLPDDRLQKCQLLLRQFNLWRKVSLRELQSLLGLLNFTCSIVVPGRAFLRRMIDLTRGTQRSHHRIRLTKEAKCDMHVWLSFLQTSTVKPFSTLSSGTVIVPLNCFLMGLAQKAMALSSVSIGFSARGRMRG